MTGLEITLYLFSGLILLFIGAEGLIRGSSNLALKIGITPLVVGLTVVAFGTSAPELVVSLKAALMGNSSISLGNVVGSNIANIALILGTAAFIRPLSVSTKVIKKEIPVMIGFSVLLIIFLLDGEISFIDGLVFILLLIAYNVVNVVLARKEKNLEIEDGIKEVLKSKFGITLSIFFVVLGLASLVFGANLFVQGAVAIAKLLKLSDAVIGLTIISIGTSLPELTTSVVASYRKETDIAIGSVVGSNIFNILSILGITALIVPISSAGISYIDLSVMLFLAIILLPLSRTGYSISRMEGAFLLFGYAVYIYYLIPK